MKELLNAIQHGEIWLTAFNRCDYEKSFAQYCARYEPLYTAAVIETAPQQLAQHLTEGIAESWKKTRFWKRSVTRANDKMMVVSYLTPMLLQCSEERCHVLAEALCDAWNAKWPDNPYHTADYAAIQGGFRNTVMGFDIDRGK